MADNAAMENDVMGLLFVTWIVQGIINSRRTGAITRLTDEVNRLKQAIEQLGATAKL